jgi:hypothetical protein
MTDWEKQVEEQRLKREERLKEQKASVLKLWGELKIKEVHFVFSCGGDSMNDTSIEVYDTNDDLLDCEIVTDIENYFDDVVYDNVNFYVNSDGHYMGEDGKVTITLDEDDEDEFVYYKDSQEEWCENEVFTEKFELTDEEVEFIDKYVDDINGSMDENELNVNYKVDFVQTDELIAIEEKLLEKINDYFDDYEHNLENATDWSRIEVQGDTLDKDKKTIELEMSFEHYVYKGGED